MPGGLLNLVSEGQQNVILNGNPSKTFWKTTYSKYTNYGKQNFRVDFDGAKTLRLSEESTFSFRIPRYADLLMDCYLSVSMPHIWSAIMPPVEIVPENTETPEDAPAIYSPWAPYEFKWIENLGSQMISKIIITCGNQKLQEFSGQYLLSAVQRDFDKNKKDLFDEMTGNVPEMTDPGNSGNRSNSYPNTYYTINPSGAEPSIRARMLYIPLNSWFNLKTQMSFPLVAMQYNELTITVIMRPIRELFIIRDISDHVNMFPYVAPNFNNPYMAFYRFLQTPPDAELTESSYVDTRTLWNADIHLNCTYCFLSTDEQQVFAKNEQAYLFKQVQEYKFYNTTGSNKISLDSTGLIASWMFYFRRSDANLRNSWSNYTNWPYDRLPSDLINAPVDGDTVNLMDETTTIGPGINFDSTYTGLMITNDYNVQNQKDILLVMGIIFDGQYRENVIPSGVYNFIEKYTRTSGNAPVGLYCYNFCLNTSAADMQPSGAINMSRFSKIEMEFTTVVPPADPLAQSIVICDQDTGNVIGINKPSWQIYDYNFNLTVFEERINVLTFIGGNAGLMYAT